MVQVESVSRKGAPESGDSEHFFPEKHGMDSEAFTCRKMLDKILCTVLIFV